MKNIFFYSILKDGTARLELPPIASECWSFHDVAGPTVLRILKNTVMPNGCLPFPAALVHDFIDDAARFFFLLFNRADECKLRSTAIEVLVLSLDLEIPIPEKVIGQKTEADLKTDQFSGKWKQFDLKRFQKIGGAGQITAGECLEHLNLHTNFRAIAFGFRSRTGRRSDKIAKIVES